MGVGKILIARRRRTSYWGLLWWSSVEKDVQVQKNNTLSSGCCSGSGARWPSRLDGKKISVAGGIVFPLAFLLSRFWYLFVQEVGYFSFGINTFARCSEIDCRNTLNRRSADSL